MPSTAASVDSHYRSDWRSMKREAEATITTILAEDSASRQGAEVVDRL